MYLQRLKNFLEVINMQKDTLYFKNTKPKMNNKEVLEQIYNSLEERGYNAIDQMVGYMTSGDPSYITSHNDARNLILKIDRDELLEEILKSYLGLNTDREDETK